MSHSPGFRIVSAPASIGSREFSTVCGRDSETSRRESNLVETSPRNGCRFGDSYLDDVEAGGRVDRCPDVLADGHIRRVVAAKMLWQNGCIDHLAVFVTGPCLGAGGRSDRRRELLSLHTGCRIRPRLVGECCGRIGSVQVRPFQDRGARGIAMDSGTEVGIRQFFDTVRVGFDQHHLVALVREVLGRL